MEFLINISFFLFLLGLGFVFGRMNESRHFRRLRQREADLAYIVVSNTKKMPEGMTASQFVSGNVVISIDYYKRLAAGIRGIFGGQIRSYTSLLERARREAVVRLKEQAKQNGMTHISNLRLETSSVFQNAKNNLGSLEVYAYGTALK